MSPRPRHRGQAGWKSRSRDGRARVSLPTAGRCLWLHFRVSVKPGLALIKAGGLYGDLFGGKNMTVGLSWIIGLVQKALDARQGPLQSSVDVDTYLKT